jgi:hypothetical protein
MPVALKLGKKKRGKIATSPDVTRRVALREYAAELERIKALLLEATRKVDALWVALYTTGLDDRGPITENESDIPF